MASSADVKMSNWKAAEILEMLALLSLCSCQLVVVAATVATFKLKAPARIPVINSNGLQCKAFGSSYCNIYTLVIGYLGNFISFSLVIMLSHSHHELPCMGLG